MRKLLLIFSLIFSQIFFAQSDCNTAITICGDTPFSYTPTGPGVQELPEGNCGSYTEKFSVWYKFTISSAGTLTLVIHPLTSTPTDYDFYIFGPNVTCANKGNAIRCATSYTPGDTGMSMTATMLHEQPGNSSTPPGWVKYMDVLPGETYYLLVNNYTENNNGFSLTWGGTAHIASPFNDPLLAPHPFLLPGQDQDGIVYVCGLPKMFDLTTLTPQIVNGNPNFGVTYYATTNDMLSGVNPITSANVTATTTIYYTISWTNPNNPNDPRNNCKQYGTVKFKDAGFSLNPVTLTECSNNMSGVATYNLTSANVYPTPGPYPIVSKKFYPSINDAINEINEITNPVVYTSAEGIVYVKYKNNYDCTAIAPITLKFYPIVPVQNATLTSCFIEGEPHKGKFDLTTATVTTMVPNTRTYHPSLQDAINNTNSIANPTTYISPATDVYVRVMSANGCWNVAKITLNVTPPRYSTVLKDQIICVEGVATLDAGPGFTAYLWSTGATTQSINNVKVGEYWVNLTNQGCVTKQRVKVIASPQPVVTNIDISNSTITVNVSGGTPPYKYSLDNIVWQTSNVFNNVPRGKNVVWIKDAYDCDPIQTEITVPNLVNAITPNNDNVNDVIDYSALAYKNNLVFSIFDRYGTKIYQADKTNNYQWNGSYGGKKVKTGTYWYTVTWNEPSTNIPVKYTGWVMVKNRD